MYKILILVLTIEDFRLASLAAEVPLPTLEYVVEGSYAYQAKHQVEYEGLHLLLLLIDILDRYELVWLQAHLSLDHVKLGKEALLVAKDHVQSLS